MKARCRGRMSGANPASAPSPSRAATCSIASGTATDKAQIAIITGTSGAPGASLNTSARKTDPTMT
jgi:hypothetical protein